MAGKHNKPIETLEIEGELLNVVSYASYAKIFWQSASLGRTNAASISVLPESPPQ